MGMHFIISFFFCFLKTFGVFSLEFCWLLYQTWLEKNLTSFKLASFFKPEKFAILSSVSVETFISTLVHQALVENNQSLSFLDNQKMLIRPPGRQNREKPRCPVSDDKLLNKHLTGLCG